MQNYVYIEEFYGKTIFMKNFIKKLCINKKNNYQIKIR